MRRLLSRLPRSNPTRWLVACGLLSTSLPFCAHGAADVSLQFLQSQYLSETQNQSQTDSYSSLGLALSFSTESKRWNGGLQALGSLTMDGSENTYVAVPEIYIGARDPRLPNLSLTVGRKRELWSRFDQEWGLGIWQPYVRWDYLHPREQGLIGAFLTGQNEMAKVTAFATGIYLPDQGPQFEVEDGEFHSSNRWFRQPQNRHTVLDEERRLNYVLDEPDPDEILFHAGYGLMLIVGKEKAGPWLRMAVANKPMNQLHIGIEGYHSIARDDHFLESVAIVHPTVARHTVTTVEAGIDQSDWALWASISEENPENPNLPEDWEEASLNDSRYFGVTGAHRLPWTGLRRQWVKYSYMKVEERRRSLGAAAEDNLESSLDRFPFHEVAGVEWTAPLIERSQRRLNMNVRYLYSIPEVGGLLSAGMDLAWNKNTRWNVGVDILGSNTDPTSDNAGLMSLYRNNDRITGGMTYVF